MFRLIPAGAGKTREMRFLPIPDSAHPRRCGENGKAALVSHSVVGSSPQVRGKRLCAKFVHMRFRLIPAGAGKTHQMAFFLNSGSAHPRRCGENISTMDEEQTARGSSPQVRGKHLLTWSFIPT